MSSLCLANILLNSIRMSSTSFSSSSISWESFHLKFLRMVSRPSGLILGFIIRLSFSSLSSRSVLLWIGVCVSGSFGISGVGNQKIGVVGELSSVFRSTLTSAMAFSESSSASTFRAVVFNGVSSFTSSGDKVLNFAFVVFFLTVWGVGVVFVTLT